MSGKTRSKNSGRTFKVYEGILSETQRAAHRVQAGSAPALCRGRRKTGAGLWIDEARPKSTSAHLGRWRGEEGGIFQKNCIDIVHTNDV